MANKPVLLLTQRSYPSNGGYAPGREIRDTVHTRKLIVCPECSRGQHCSEMALEHLNKQRHVQLIEQKYAGRSMETQHAAQIIQQNFRQYTLSKKFEKLRNSHEQRLMRDVPSDRDSVWSDVEVTSLPSSPHLSSVSDNSDRSDSANGNYNDVSSQRPQNMASTSTVVYVNAFAPVNDGLLGYARSQPISYSPTGEAPAPQRGLYERGRARKRKYRIGLIMFNKSPERGIKYLMEQKYLANSAQAVAEFLVHRKGLSRQKIGEYVGDLRKSFNQDVLVWVIRSIKLAGLDIDQGLRKVVGLFRLPGESQQIETVVERYSQWYCVCNPAVADRFKSVDTIFVLAFAIIMLNTDLHNRNIRPCNKMKMDAFVKNLRGVDDGQDIPEDILVGIYERILAREFKADPDHVSQVRKVEESLIGKVPELAIPHRRLVCYCRLYEIADPGKKEKLGLHQREVFLFNDLLVITKIFAKKKDVMTYTFRRSISLNGLVVQSFTTEHYQHGIKLLSSQSRTPLICFNARNTHDREKFVDDLIETITEVKEYRSIQLDTESKKRSLAERSRMSKDSGVADLDLAHYGIVDHPCVQQLPVRGTAEESRSSSLTELQMDKSLTKSQSNRSVDSCVLSRNVYQI